MCVTSFRRHSSHDCSHSYKSYAPADRSDCCHLATLLADGRPQVNPVWCDYDGTYVRVNAAADRQRARNMRRRGFATVFVADGPYFWMEIRGRVIHSTTEGAMDHMHSMAKKYTGRDTYTPIRTGEVRVMFTIEPERVVTFGTGATS